MFAVVAILAWALLLGVTARRFGAVQQGLLLAGIAGALLVQYTVFGPS